MPVSKELLKKIPMYFDSQLTPLESLLLALKNNTELTEENKKYLSNLDNVPFLFQKVFSNDFENCRATNKKGIPHRDSVKIDPQTEYFTNTNGFRSREFSKDSKVIALGCSHTHGIGLRKDLVWTSQLAKMMGLNDIDNLGICGGSMMYIVESAFKYFYKIGNPEYVVLLAPDLYRFLATSNSHFNVPDYFKKGIHIPFLENNWASPEAYSDRPKMMKAPYKTRDIMPMEYAFWLNMQFLKMLITYCRSSNIKLIWSTWNMPFANLAQTFKNEGNDLFDEFFYYDYTQFANVRADEPGCHLDLLDVGKEYFYHALDVEVSGAPHWGSHMHMHIAEEFFKEIQRVDNER